MQNMTPIFAHMQHVYLPASGYTLKTKNVSQACNHGNWGSLVKRTLSDREGNHGLSLWQSRALTNISTCGETEALLSIFIPTHSSFDVLRVTQRTLRSLPHHRRDCWLTQEPYVDALHLRTCSIFESSRPWLQIDSPRSLPLLRQPLRDALHTPSTAPPESNPAPNSSSSSQCKMY